MWDWDFSSTADTVIALGLLAILAIAVVAIV